MLNCIGMEAIGVKPSEKRAVPGRDIFVRDAPVSWSSRAQRCVTLPATESNNDAFGYEDSETLFPGRFVLTFTQTKRTMQLGFASTTKSHGVG